MPTLNWLDRAHSLRQSAQVPCRILRVNRSLSHGDADSGNLLIQGDNLHALKALMPYFRGQVKCVFIDPPYNTKSAFEHYQDSLEHSKWLDMMVPRLELLRELLAEDGSIWVTIDDNEAHYLKVVMDEIFGRGNFVANCVWQKKFSPQANSQWLSDSHDHILVYAKSKTVWRPRLLPRTEESDSRYANPDNDPRGAWTSGDFTISLTGGQRGAQYARTGESENIYEITTPSGRKLLPTKGRCWIVSPKRFIELKADNRIWFGEKGNNVPRIKRFLTDVQEGIVAMTFWTRADAGDNQEAKKEVVAFNADEIFSTPKPERLIKRILELATQEGDLVLDSFLGSGTTAAVAHKMNRRYIGIEMGEHARTHCAARLKKVIEGEQGGISKAVNWQGGGGFRFYTLGAALFAADGTIHPDIKFAHLAAYLWFFETRTPWTGKGDSPLLGIHNGTAYYLLYNGILKDNTTAGGNILTASLLRQLPAHEGKKVIYALGSRLSADWLAANGIQYRHIPHQIPRTDSPKRRSKSTG